MVLTLSFCLVSDSIVTLFLNSSASLLRIWGMKSLNLKRLATKDSFLRALTEVVPEMELFQENHGQHMKNFVTQLIYIQSCTFRYFTKKLYLEKYV